MPLGTQHCPGRGGYSCEELTSLEDGTDTWVGNYNKVRETDDAVETTRMRILTQLEDIKKDFQEESNMEVQT